MPSKHLYSTIIYNEFNTKRFSSVGQEVVKFLCRVEDVSVVKGAGWYEGVGCVWVGECGPPGVRRREGPYKNNNSNPQITGTSTVMYSYTLPPHPHIEHVWFPVWPRLWHCDWAESGDCVQADSWCLHDLQRLTQALQRLLPLFRHHLLPQSLSTAPVQSLRRVS